jgi:hypothetical protein
MARLVDPNTKKTSVMKPLPKAETAEVPSLPKIDVPIYDLKIPSTGQIIQVRPFTVAEEKLLMMAAESKDMEEIVKRVMQVLHNCIIAGEVNLNKLPFFDIDFMFIFLRAKSVGESVDLKLICNNEVKDKKCGNPILAELNISKTEIYKDENITNDITLEKDKGVVMKYPNYDIIKRLDDEKNPIDKKTNIIINSIDYIYDKKQRYYSKDFTKQELKKFVEELTQENYNKLEHFTENFPSFYNRLEVTCNKCGFHHDVRYTDFEPFFT